MRHLPLRRLALVGATGVAVAAWVAAAALRPGLAASAVIALLAFLASGHLLLRAADRLAGGEAPSRRWIWLGVGALIYGAAAQLAVGRTPAPTLAPPVSAEAYQLWTLPDGTEIAYRPFAPEGNDPQGIPVIMLHGGPGVPILPALGPPGSGPLDFLAESGFSVFYYDQRGAGFSGRLDLAREPPYTVASHVADLEGSGRRWERKNSSWWAMGGEPRSPPNTSWPTLGGFPGWWRSLPPRSGTRPTRSWWSPRPGHG